MNESTTRRKSARRISRRFLLAAIAGTAAFGTVAGAAPNYPTRPIRLFVPYGPGGVGDLTMRILADKASEQLKQQFVIENRPGAGGISPTSRYTAIQPVTSSVGSPLNELQTVGGVAGGVTAIKFERIGT